MARPAQQNVLRTPSGQKSRSQEALGMEARLILEAATWKRRQQNPELTISDARLPEHGSVIARWHQDWKAACKRNPEKAHENMFSELHKDAAERYHGLYLRWLATISARNPRSSTDFSGTGGFDGTNPFDEARTKRDTEIERSFKEARRAVLESGPLGMMAIEAIVIENQPAQNLRGDLRMALNSLARLWKMME